LPGADVCARAGGALAYPERPEAGQGHVLPAGDFARDGVERRIDGLGDLGPAQAPRARGDVVDQRGLAVGLGLGYCDALLIADRSDMASSSPGKIVPLPTLGQPLI
jgi:hypothetical protein